MAKTIRSSTGVAFFAIAVLAVLGLTILAMGHGKAVKEVDARTRDVTVVSGVLGVGGGVAVPSPPPLCGCTPAAGIVRLTDANGHRIFVTTTRFGTFSVRVPDGRYRVVAGLNPPYNWPMGSCDSGTTGLSGDGVHFDRSKHVNYLTVNHERKMTIYVGCTA
jgi:hypothetical protein